MSHETIRCFPRAWKRMLPTVFRTANQRDPGEIVDERVACSHLDAPSSQKSDQGQENRQGVALQNRVPSGKPFFSKNKSKKWSVQIIGRSHQCQWKCFGHGYRNSFDCVRHMMKWRQSKCDILFTATNWSLLPGAHFHLPTWYVFRWGLQNQAFQTRQVAR